MKEINSLKFWGDIYDKARTSYEDLEVLVEFYGEGARDLTLGDRATISNMTPEFGATAAMFYIDEKTIDYLKLTGRDDEQVKLVENYAKTSGLWADDLDNAEYERVLKFDLSHSNLI